MTQMHSMDALQSQPHPTKEWHHAQWTENRPALCQVKSEPNPGKQTASGEVKPRPSKPLNHPNMWPSFAWQSAVFASLIWWGSLQTNEYLAYDEWKEAGDLFKAQKHSQIKGQVKLTSNHQSQNSYRHNRASDWLHGECCSEHRGVFMNTLLSSKWKWKMMKWKTGP